MTDSDPHASLRDLKQGLERARQGRGGSTPPRGDVSGERNALGMAFRVSTELVVAVIVGVGIGWAFDRWLGTRPWGMVVFFFLGIAAGLINVYRAIAGLGMAIGYRQSGSAAPPPKGFEDEEDGD
jgi:ATP synthase protein I